MIDADDISFTLYILNIFELCILLTDILQGGFFCLIALRLSIFHRNLSFLCIGLYLSACVIIFSQTALNIAAFYDFKILAPETIFIREGWAKYIEWIRIGGCGGILSFVACIILERGLATIRLKTYERNTNYILLTYSFLSSILIATLGSTVVMEKSEFLPYILGVCIVSSMIFGFIFFYTFEFNKRRYKETQRNPTLAFSLSERFQLRENIRIMTIMKKCVFVLSVGNVLILVAVALQFTNIPGIQYIIRKIVNILVVFNAIVFNYVAIKNIPPWNRMAKQMITTLCFKRIQKIWDSKASAMDHIKTFQGKPMVFSIEKERDIYFKQLNDSWNI